MTDPILELQKADSSIKDYVSCETNSEESLRFIWAVMVSAFDAGENSVSHGTVRPVHIKLSDNCAAVAQW